MIRFVVIIGVLIVALAAIWNEASEFDWRTEAARFSGDELSWKDLAIPGALTESHTFLGDDCRSCHTVVVGIERANCVTCHVAEEALLGRQPTAFHAEVAECSGCHVEHEGNDKITQMDHSYLQLIAGRDPRLGLDFTALESELTEAAKALIDGASVGDDRKLICSNCHGNEDVHLGLFASDCAECHSDKTWDIAGFRHPSPASTECSQCHQAPPSHYMGHFNMVSRSVARKPHSPVEACQDCHQTNAWNDIVNLGYYKHH